ncbi:MAG: hydantoinase, partial [Ignavibacteriaceae bacterium]|nr:hydantoinase [Ignavibacteriaceae bacterium]
DEEGTIRLQVNNAFAFPTTVANVKGVISKIINEMTTYGDAGALIPGFFLLAGPKIIDLSGLISETQLLSIAEIELKNTPPDAHCVVIAEKKL